MKQLGRRGLAVFLTCLFLTGAATEVRAAPITVMTQNLYIGADIAPVLGAQNPTDLLIALANAQNSIVANDFSARAGAIANEVFNAGSPLLIGLQEATTITGTGGLALDYTQILIDQLALKGLNYSVVESHTGLQFALGPYSAVDHDVVLALTGVPGFTIINSGVHTFANNLVLDLLGNPIPTNRGYVSVDASLDGVPFQLISTHLDDTGQFDKAQVGEILAGLPSTGLQLVIGDFNSTPTDPAYLEMVAAGFIDAAAAVGPPGVTCCQDSDLNNSVSALSSRIDYVFERNFDSIPSALLVGDTPFENTRPQWPSDHAGLIASVAVPEPPTATIFLVGLMFLGFRKFSPGRRWVRA
jgi:endonuclease/exonuclease/phosphatase family metal-dependent hydrolase